MRRVLLQSPRFLRQLRRLGKKQPAQAPVIQTVLESLAEDAFQPSLHLHKLKGELAGTWACAVAYDLRIVLEFVEHEGAEAILLHSVGTHDEVY